MRSPQTFKLDQFLFKSYHYFPSGSANILAVLEALFLYLSESVSGDHLESSLMTDPMADPMANSMTDSMTDIITELHD